MKRPRQLCSFSFERTIWKKGFRFIGGVDEVGRGCFAGPVVAGCVVFKSDFDEAQLGNSRIDDSKKLSALQREKADQWIRKNAAAWGIGTVQVSVINKVGISKATKIAFRRAIKEANERLWGTIDYLLIDAFYIPYTRGLKRENQQPLVHGDEMSYSIASASIIAKVYRDRLMEKLGSGTKYRKYHWGSNKGYGTKEQQIAIEKYGISRYHRKQFVETWLSKRGSKEV